MSLLTDEEILKMAYPVRHCDLDDGEGAIAIHFARAIEAAVIKKLREQEPVFVVFDGPPDNEASRFVEVETPAGFSVKVGEWKPYGKYWTLGPLFEHPAPQPEWKPIETAPKDGTAMLVMRDIWPGTKSGRAEECNGHNTYVAAWWQGERDGQGAWICYMDSVCDPECPIDPTHWMPLPAPPSNAK